MSSDNSNKTVLVTGASGFLASYVIDAFLKKGYKVKGTVRDPAKAQHLKERYPSGSQLELVQVKDLSTGEGLDEAVKGCWAIAHVASPYFFNITDPKTDLLDPAVEGTLTTLRAAKKVGIKRIAITSSFAAVTNLKAGGPWREYTYSEKDWNPATEQDVNKDTPGAFVYSLSKAMAERAGRKYGEENGLEIVTLNPPMIYGPPLQTINSASEVNTSCGAIYSLINGSTDGAVPPNRLPLFCHVEDVATAHVLAVEGGDEVVGGRFLINGGSFTWEEVSQFLQISSPTSGGTANQNDFKPRKAILHLQKVRPELASRLPQIPDERADLKAGPLAKIESENCKTVLGMKEFKTWQETLVGTIDRLVEMEKKWEKKE